MQAHTAYTAHAPAAAPRRTEDNAMPALYRAALGPLSTERYLAFFERQDDTGRTLASWNWAAALCTLNWMVLRQLWSAALVYVAALEGVALLVFALGHQLLGLSLPVLAGLVLAWLAAACALPGLYGDSIVHAEVRKKITKALSASANLPQAIERLEKQAATPRRAAWIAGINAVLLVLAATAWWFLPGGGPAALDDLRAPRVVGAVQPAATPASAAVPVADPASAAAPTVTPTASDAASDAAPAAVPVSAASDAAAPPAPAASEATATASSANAAPPQAPASAAAAVAPASPIPPASRATPAASRQRASAPAAAATASAPAPAARARASAASAPAPSKRAVAASRPVTAAPATAAVSAASAPADRKLFINVGLFGDPANAQRAHARLQDAGLPSSLGTVTMGSGRKLTRVRVGPFASSSEANAAAAQVREMGLDTAATQQ